MSAPKENFKDKWEEVKGKIKLEYADLTEDDLLYEEGKEDELFGRLRSRMGKSKEEMTHYLKHL